MPDTQIMTQYEVDTTFKFCDELIDFVHAMRMHTRWHDKGSTVDLYQTFYETVANLGTFLGLKGE